RRDPENIEDSAERLKDRAGGWLEVMTASTDLHPITRACMGFHLWSLAGLGQHGDQIESADTASRIAASDGSGAIFAPLAMGGAGGLRVSGSPAERLARWLDGMNSAILTAMRTLDDIEAWTGRAENVMAQLSGRTPVALRETFSQWPLVSAPMAEAVTGASRAAVQRNLTWLEASGLIREVTGQGRYRMWCIAD
ncbi:helix-turn-helix domain-containing protein, partial [Sulfitobacter mediterraneus]